MESDGGEDGEENKCEMHLADFPPVVDDLTSPIAPSLVSERGRSDLGVEAYFDEHGDVRMTARI